MPGLHMLHGLARLCGRGRRTDAGFPWRLLRWLPSAASYARQAEMSGVRHIHAHFAFAPADVGRLMAAIMGVRYSVSAHASTAEGMRRALAGVTFHDPEPILLANADALVASRSVKVTAAQLAKAKQLKVVAYPGPGTEFIDVDAATAAGILVMNLPGESAVSVAEHTLGLMLAFRPLSHPRFSRVHIPNII